MGFGTLFIGYFMLLNVTYYGFSDFIAAAVMLFGLYKLSRINNNFKASTYAVCAFCVFALYELVVFSIDMFSLKDYSTMLTATSAIRSLIICVCTVPMLLGMRDVCYEVDLKDLGKKCHITVIPTFVVYSLAILAEAQGVFSFVDTKYVAIFGLLTMLGTMVLVVVNLISIYTCYMKICMPDEEASKKKKKAPAFVEAFRRHEEEKQREYIEYKLDKKRDKAHKNDGKKK